MLRNTLVVVTLAALTLSYAAATVHAAARGLSVAATVPVPSQFRTLGVASSNGVVWTTDGTATLTRIDPNSQGVAATTVPGHFTGTFSFPANWCGFDGIDTVTVNDNFGSQLNGTTWDAGRLVETFVADNGRGVSITYDAGREENVVPVGNPDGTTTLTYVYSGLNAKTQAVGGPVLQQNAGRILVTVVLDAEGNLISISVVDLAGPNPNLTGAPDCSVIGPYLAGS